MKKKPEPEFDTSSLGNMKPEAVEAHNREMRLSANPAMGRMMDQVQDAIDAENVKIDAQFEGDAKLRSWAKKLLGFQISMTQIEELQKQISGATPGKPFMYLNVSLVKTSFGSIDRTETYIKTLERTVIDVMNNSQFTTLPFSGLIKLAFKRLFTRSK